MEYKKGTLTKEMLNETFEHLMKQSQKPREMKFYTSELGMGLIEATLSGNEDEAERISKEIRMNVAKSIGIGEVRFLEHYSEKILSFIKEVKKDSNWLIGWYPGKGITIAYWDIKDEEGFDTDTYHSISFLNGRFLYREQYVGGYGGSKIIENNLTQERVLELVEQNKNG